MVVYADQRLVRPPRPPFPLRPLRPYSADHVCAPRRAQVYSCRFGNFLGNSSMARSEWRNRTRSLWEEVNGDKATFVNTRWKGADSAAVLQLPGGMLRPACDKLQLKLWPEYRRRWNVSTAMQDPVTHLTGRLLM